jgi:hypothetical protein
MKTAKNPFSVVRSTTTTTNQGDTPQSLTFLLAALACALGSHCGGDGSGAVRSDAGDTPRSSDAATILPGSDAATSRVDTETTSCTEFPANILQNTTIVAGCYLVNATPSLATGVELRLSPGVTLVFAEDAWLEIRDKSRIRANGTAAKPITFTSTRKTPGSWGGVVATGPRVEAEFSYAQIEYAGAPIPGVRFPVELGTAGVTLNTAGLTVGDQVTLSLDHTTIVNNAGYGLAIDYMYTSLKSFTNNTIAGNERALLVPAHVVAALDASSSYKGNGVDRVELASADVNSNSTWVDVGVPYHARYGVYVQHDSALLLNAGVHILFNQGTGLVAEGDLTTGGVVVLEGEQSVPEYWYGVVECGEGHVGLSAETAIRNQRTDATSQSTFAKYCIY